MTAGTGQQQIDAMLADARRAALEEAAQKCEGAITHNAPLIDGLGTEAAVLAIAAVIRALASPPAEEEGSETPSKSDMTEFAFEQGVVVGRLQAQAEAKEALSRAEAELAELREVEEAVLEHFDGLGECPLCLGTAPRQWPHGGLVGPINHRDECVLSPNYAGRSAPAPSAAAWPADAILEREG